MNGQTVKAIRKKAVENVRKTYGTVTENLCEKEYKRLKKLYKQK